MNYFALKNPKSKISFKRNLELRLFILFATNHKQLLSNFEYPKPTSQNFKLLIKKCVYITTMVQYNHCIHFLWWLATLYTCNTLYTVVKSMYAANKMIEWIVCLSFFNKYILVAHRVAHFLILIFTLNFPLNF